MRCLRVLARGTGRWSSAARRAPWSWLRRATPISQIADALGYANRGTVHRLVQQTLHAHQADSVDALRAVEVARLDALQQSLWEPAMAGDLKAVGQVLQIIVARSRLLGLMPLAKSPRVKCRQPQTVVLMKDDCRLRGCPDNTSGQEPSTLA